MLAAQRRTGAVPKTALPSERLPAWKEILEAVEPFLQSVAGRLAAQSKEFEPEIGSFTDYTLSAQGKQLRPILISLGSQSVGTVGDPHITLAVIIEMVHLATLVHDDVIDEAKLRRARETPASKWGNEISVLLGDCLFAHALSLAASYPTPEICRAVSAATNTVCAGEILQSKSRGNFEITMDHYYKVLAMKTAELFSLSCDLGGFLSQATPEQRQALRRYGLALGTAYQLYDDCLDLLGSESSAGKTVGADLAKGKVTLPILIVRDRATPAERAQLQNWVVDWDARHLPEVMELLHNHNALKQSRAIIQTYLEAANNAADLLPSGNGRNSLKGLTHFLAQQTEALGVI
jgi:octaprenyl-diphosphate synthase